MSSPTRISKKRELKQEKSSSRKWRFSERESPFSLEYRAFRPSAVFGTRREAALRGAAYGWVPDLRIFNKLLKVRVSPYLGFILSLSTLSMFESNETVRGRLNGPKPWDQIDKIFGTPNGAAMTATADLGC